jgi:hypothetical protein
MKYSLGQIESGILRLKWLAAATRFEIALRNHDRALKAGYRSDQPRVSAGSSDGGQWTSGGGGVNADAGSDVDFNTDVDADVQRILALARRLAASGNAMSYQMCLNRCYPLLERLKPPGSDRNTWDFIKCMNACMGRNR